jgi:hypothetical protein
MSCHDRKRLAFPQYSTLPIKGMGGKPHHHVSSPAARTGFWKWMLMALHDSRYREAKRIIGRNQHLLSSDVPTTTEAGPSKPTRLPGPSKMGMKIVMMAIVAVFVVAHGFALHEMHSTGQIDLSPPMPSVYGD